ncbi:hypothetical protein EDC01DRAFT_629803 [Geopyxis carbonaria]|nr:hypothetical protein EDC01DRAFT_629803 [Geopyxis carbonaria]
MENLDYLAVGIDIGLTGTGVAYSAYQSGSVWDRRDKVVEEWPGTTETIYKVPTRIAYQTQQRVFKPWGFLCDPDATGTSGAFNPSNYEVKEYFKLLLEDDIREFAVAQDGPTSLEVQQWFTDFLSALYEWVQQVLSHEFRQQNFGNATVEYIFSVPTTWSNQSVVDRFKVCIREAGFGRLNNHFFTIGLTEAEAAAVYTMNTMNTDTYSVGDTLIVCDAGGGTTDITVLTITSHENDIYRMEQLGLVEGGDIGSVQIDKEFRELVHSRLQNDPSATSDIRNIFKQFQDIKHRCGYHPMRAATVPRLASCHSLSITFDVAASQLLTYMNEFCRNEIRHLFDDKIMRIIQLVNNQLKMLGDREVANFKSNPFLCIKSYLVLSGGLGSSHYVKMLLTQYFHPESTSASNLSAPYPNLPAPSPCARNMEILQAAEPQLAVCKGLVIDRMLRLSTGTVVISRLSRASYGILYNEKFNKVKHRGQSPQIDPIDGKYYAMDQIRWLIDQGSPIDERKPLRHAFSRNIDFNGKHKRWRDRVVMYNGPQEFRPMYLREGETVPQYFQVVREILSDLEPRISDVATGAATKKYRHWFRIGSKYWQINYEMRIAIGAADVGFELWYNNRRRSREGNENIIMDWEAALAEDSQDDVSNLSEIGHPGQRLSVADMT